MLKRLREDWYDLGFSDYVDRGNYGINRWRVTKPFRFIWSYISFGFLELICKFRGHNLVDDSVCGPDSGNMDHHCSRCGQSWEVTLY